MAWIRIREKDLRFTVLSMYKDGTQSWKYFRTEDAAEKWIENRNSKGVSGLEQHMICSYQVRKLQVLEPKNEKENE